MTTRWAKMAGGCFGAVLVLGAAPSAYSQGVKVGEFLVKPQVEVQEVYNDNIYTEDTNEESDFITKVLPSISVQSQFDKHAVGARLSAEGGVYADNSDDNYLDATGRVFGRADAWEGGSVNAFGSFTKEHENRGSADARDATAPTDYTVGAFGAGARHREGSFSISANGRRDSYNYDDTDRQGLTTLNNDDRDRDEDLLRLRAGYNLSPNYEIFVTPSVNQRDYDSQVDDNGRQKDSQGGEVMVGFGFGFPGTASGEVAGGVMHQTFDDPGFEDITTARFAASTEYIVVPELSVRVSAYQSLSETTQANVSAIIGTGGSLTVDYLATRDLTVRGTASYTRLHYEAAQGVADFDEDLPSVSLEGLYEINRMFYAGLGVTHSRRLSDLQNSDYTQNKASVRLGVKY